jgi:exonuclease SbcC
VRAAADDLARARTAESSARTTHDEGVTLAEEQRRHAAALAELDHLDEHAPAHEQRVARLAAARRAAPVTPLLRLARDAARAADRELGSAVTSMTEAGADPRSDDPADVLSCRADSLADRVAAARAALPREADLAELERAHAAATADAQRAVAELDELAAQRAALPGLLDDARTSLADAAAARSSLATDREELARVDERLAACRLLRDLSPVLATAGTRRLEAQTRLADARERWLAVREARLEGMAAELASRLAVGGCCPVCGSAEHPQPAAAAAGTPDAAAEKAARRLVDDAEAALHLCEEELRALETECALARQRAGDDPSVATVEAERAAAAERLADAERRARAHDDLVAAVADHERQLAALEAAVAGAEQRRIAHGVRRDEAERAMAAVRDEIAAVLADSGHGSLRALLAALESDRASVAAALDALAAHEHACREHRRTAAAAHDAARRAGFCSTAGAECKR